MYRTLYRTCKRAKKFWYVQLVQTICYCFLFFSITRYDDWYHFALSENRGHKITISTRNPKRAKNEMCSPFQASLNEHLLSPWYLACSFHLNFCTVHFFLLFSPTWRERETRWTLIWIKNASFELSQITNRA